MGGFEELLERLEELMAEMEQVEEPTRSQVFELLDGIDAIHRRALTKLAESIGRERLEHVRQADPAIEWLFDAYGTGADQGPAAEAALDSIRPYIHSHGGKVEVLQATGGIVRLRLSGSCSGCTASAITLQRGVEEALREHMPGFVAMEVETLQAEPHPPPGPTLLQIQPRPARPEQSAGA